jgi:hypothetical protein
VLGDANASDALCAVPIRHFSHSLGPSRHFAATHHFGRPLGEADIEPDL